MWYDGVGRTVANADYGTNNDDGPPDRPASPPESSDEVLVSRVSYNDRAEAFETVDPAGVMNCAEADDAGRMVRTIKNYVIGEGCFCPGAEENVTTEMQYRAGQLVALVAKNQATGDQVTRFLYGVTLADSNLASNDLLRAEIFSDADDSTDRVVNAYNRQGQKTRMTDRNGSVHEYSFDGLGRPTADVVTTLANGVDDTVRCIGLSYEVRGMMEKAISFSGVAGTTVVNEVQNEYNDFAQLSKRYQESNGAVNTGTTPKVQYGYSDGSANTIRPVSMTYPNGRVLDYLYDDTHADELSRIRTLHWDDADVCRYDYLGLNTFVTTDYLQPKVKLDYALGLSPNPYAGFDRFGRIIDLLWEKYGNGSSSSSSSSGPNAELVHLMYGYDRASNRTYRRDEAARSDNKTLDELYEYDRLNQVKKFHRGLLVNENTVIESPGLQQGWQFDATGNWKNFTQFDPTDAANTLDQQRSHNRVNEITEIARTVGADWSTPTYERNGNTTGDEAGKKFKYDAWNHLVEVRDVENELLATYRYYALGWRVQELRGEATTDLYYSNQWQVLEERVDGDVYAQYVWSLVYIDAMILRDRDSDGNENLDERLNAVQDANFNVVALVDTSGAVVERFAYDAFGVFSVLTPAWGARESSSYGWNYLHQGERWDADGAIFHKRRREYSPSLGRCLQNDLLGYQAGDVNFYRHVNNSPICLLDPEGLFPQRAPEIEDVTLLDGWKNLNNRADEQANLRRWLAFPAFFKPEADLLKSSLIVFTQKGKELMQGGFLRLLRFKQIGCKSGSIIQYVQIKIDKDGIPVEPVGTKEKFVEGFLLKDGVSEIDYHRMLDSLELTKQKKFTITITYEAGQGWYDGNELSGIVAGGGSYWKISFAGDTLEYSEKFTFDDQGVFDYKESPGRTVNGKGPSAELR